jgi:hypothetical protein
MSPLASHAVNLLWHIVCGLLVWLLAQRILARWGWHPTPARGAALVAALLFVTLPANVEAVAWFAARADMVATAGTLGALLLLTRFHEQGCWRAYAGLYGLGRDPWDTLLWSVWLAGAGLAIWQVRRTPPMRTRPVGWSLLAGWVLLALLPVLIFKPSPLYFLNSRYSYLASAFVMIGVGAWLMQWARPNRGQWRVPSVAAALLLLAYIGGGMRQAEAWREAGAIAHSSVLSLRNAPTDKPLVILSLPDHFHGAYIWRAGFHEGVALLLPERASQPMYALSRFTMRLRTDGRVQYADGVATLSSPDDIFLPPEGVRTPPGDEPMVLPDKVVVPLSVLQQGVVLRYDGGEFVALTP